MWETWIWSWGWEDPLEKGTHSNILAWRIPCTEDPSNFSPWGYKQSDMTSNEGFPGTSDSKESAYNVGDLGSIPGLGRSPGGGNGNPLQYFCLENFMDRGAWWATVLGSQSQMQLQNLMQLSLSLQYFHQRGLVDRERQCCCCCLVALVVSDSVRPHGLQPTRLLHPWDFPGKSTGAGCHCLLRREAVGINNSVSLCCSSLWLVRFLLSRWDSL